VQAYLSSAVALSENGNIVVVGGRTSTPISLVIKHLIMQEASTVCMTLLAMFGFKPVIPSTVLITMIDSDMTSISAIMVQGS